VASDAAAFRSSSGAPQGACGRGLAALRAGAAILTDTAMAAAAVAPMARRTSGNRVACLLDWAPDLAPAGSTRAALGMERAWAELAVAVGEGASPAPVVLIGSAPTALERLLDLVAAGAAAPSLLIGMPVGFVGVAESKRHLAEAGLDHIRLEGSRGGAGLVAAACNALLRDGGLAGENPPSLS
jgi:precorrin-8X/cobalt-precorrin-8 methylmutase